MSRFARRKEIERKQFQRKVEAIYLDYQFSCADFADKVFDILIERLIELEELPDKEWCRRG